MKPLKTLHLQELAHDSVHQVPALLHRLLVPHCCALDAVPVQFACEVKHTPQEPEHTKTNQPADSLLACFLDVGTHSIRHACLQNCMFVDLHSHSCLCHQAPSSKDTQTNILYQTCFSSCYVEDCNMANIAVWQVRKAALQHLQNPLGPKS